MEEEKKQTKTRILIIEDDVFIMDMYETKFKMAGFEVLRAENGDKGIKVARKEKPDLIVSTGSEIAIPPYILARFMRIKTIYIESWCRIKTKSGTGRILYYFSNVFLVQWPELVKLYGKKAKYRGAVI